MRSLILACLALMLVACGGGREGLAAKACENAIKARMTDRSIALNVSDMSAKAKPEGEDVIHIHSSITFDPGLPRELKQEFDCKARFVAGKDMPDVISLTFTW